MICLLPLAPASAAPKKTATAHYAAGMDFYFKGDFKRALGPLKKAAAQRPGVYPEKKAEIILCEPMSRCTEAPPPPPPTDAEKAAENAAEASCLLGDFYALGLETDVDMRAAVKWWYLPVAEYDRLLPAARKGDNAAQVALGDLFQSGPCLMHIEPDDNTKIMNTAALPRRIAQDWYTAAARAGDGQAAVKLGKILNFGYSPPSLDRDLATVWFKMAAEQGIAEGQYQYGLQLRRSGDRREGLDWLRKAEAQEYAPAIKYLEEGRTNEINSDGKYEGVVSLLSLVCAAFAVFMIRKKKPLGAYMTWRTLGKGVACIAVFALALFAISQTPFLSRLLDRMFLLLMKSRAYMPDALADNMYLFTALFAVMLVAFVVVLILLVTWLAHVIERLLSSGAGKTKP